LYNIVIQFGIPMKLVRLTKMCLTETYSGVWVGKNWSDVSYWEWFETGRCSIVIAFQLCFRIGYLVGSSKPA